MNNIIESEIEGVTVGNFVHVGKGCSIGKGTRICDHVNIYGITTGIDCMLGTFTELQCDVVIGNRVRVQSHSFICSFVTIEDDVFISHGTKFCNDSFSDGIIHFSDKDWKPVLVKKNARIGTNSTILPGVIIGENSTIGAGSVVTKSIPDNCVAWGNPCEVKYLLNDKINKA